MVKNRRGILVFAIVLVVIYFIISLIMNYAFKGKKYNNTVFIGDYTKVEISNKNIKVYNDNSKIRKQDAKIYFQKEIIDGYVMSENTGINNGLNEYYAYNKKNEVLSFESVLIAYTKDLTLKFIDFENNESDDIELAKSILKANNIIVSDDIELNTFNISSLDYDNDGNIEYIYSIGLIEDETEYDSYIYLMKDDEYHLIAREESDYNSIEYTRLYFSNLIDFNSDNDYEFVVSKVTSEYGPNYYELYNFDGDSFTKIGGE